MRSKFKTKNVKILIINQHKKCQVITDNILAAYIRLSYYLNSINNGKGIDINDNDIILFVYNGWYKHSCMQIQHEIYYSYSLIVFILFV